MPSLFKKDHAFIQGTKALQERPVDVSNVALTWLNLVENPQ